MEKDQEQSDRKVTSIHVDDSVVEFYGKAAGLVGISLEQALSLVLTLEFLRAEKAAAKDNPPSEAQTLETPVDFLLAAGSTVHVSGLPFVVPVSTRVLGHPGNGDLAIQNQDGTYAMSRCKDTAAG